MYKGTLIEELMAVVERVERRAEKERVADEEELRAIFAMQVPVTEGEPVFMGAA